MQAFWRRNILPWFSWCIDILYFNSNRLLEWCFGIPKSNHLACIPCLLIDEIFRDVNMKKTYESYPIWTVIIVNIFQLLVYVSGAYILFRLSFIMGILYILYILLLEFFLYKEACPNCYYYGKLCAFGKGKIAALFFKKGDPKKFCERELTWKDFVWQILVVLVPLVVGIALLISRGFHLLTLIALLYPVLSWLVLNPIIYGRLACPHCRQGKKCCPALEFFGKKK